MKIFGFCAFALLAFSSLTHAVLASKHQEMCDGEEAREKMGKTGTCKILVVDQAPRRMSGTCTGKMANTECKVVYEVLPGGASLSLNCGGRDYEMDAKAVGYKVVAMIRMENGKQALFDDNKYYINILDTLLRVSLVQEEESIRGESIDFVLGDVLGTISFSEVKCD